MMPTKPTPQTWILRFKNHRTTILLHIDPTQSLRTVKSALLTAIQQTHPDGILNDSAIPHNADDLILAKPLDINDLSAGWVRLEQAELGGGDGETSGKGKGKAAVNGATSAKIKRSVPAGKDSALGAGLRDGGVVAFKFRTADDEDLEQAGDGEGDTDGEYLMAISDGSRKETWDVVVPSLEELYDDGLPGLESEGEGAG